jgi:hypothetical protein
LDARGGVPDVVSFFCHHGGTLLTASRVTKSAINNYGRLIYIARVALMEEHESLVRAVVLTVIITVVAALLAGCGGGDSSGETTASGPLTKAKFVKRGNALCDAVLAERDAGATQAYEDRIAEYNRLPKAGQERLLGEVASEVDLPLYGKLVRELGEITPPAKDAKTIDRMLSKYEAVLRQLSVHPERLEQAEPLAPNAEAASYGLVSCNL